jgi:integrase
VFPITYTELNGVWQICRTHLAEQDNPLATLKALRRSAARYLHVTKGMPILLVRDYLRHSDVETTMEYLRLTGGINDAEYRRYLK